MAETIRACTVRVFETPLKRPFVTSLGRKTHTVNVGVSLILGGGASGYGVVFKLSPGGAIRCCTRTCKAL